MKAPNLDKLCAKWQKLLRLQDWAVSIVYKRACDMDGKHGWCCPRLNMKSATIKVLDVMDYDGRELGANGIALDIEVTVVHELLHLHFILLDESTGANGTLFEQAIEILAVALVDLDKARA